MGTADSRTTTWTGRFAVLQRRWVLGLAQILLYSLASSSWTQAESLSPNILFILADDLGWGDVGWHGGSTPTPHLDQLARESRELTAHYVAPVCSPTRTGLITGRHWSRYGINGPLNTRALPWETPTLPGILRTQGYSTALIGKWHLGSRAEWGPARFGFDHAYGSLAGGVSPWNHRYKQGEYSITWHRDGELIEEDGHVTDLLTAAACNWLKQPRPGPFFLQVAFTAVHLPLKEPQVWLEKVPSGIQGAVPRHYAASIMHLDAAVGQLLGTLQELGLRDNTLVVFISDNGASTAENNDRDYPPDNCPTGPIPGNNRPWRGKKGDLYEGGVRVPTLVRLPGVIPPGQESTPVQIVDWLETCADFAGIPAEVRPANDGLSLRALLTGTGSLPSRTLYAVGPAARSRAVWRENWKLLEIMRGGSWQTELYDLAQDPHEERNLADGHPETVAELRQQLSEFKQQDGLLRVQD